MRVLVTGAHGMLGSAACSVLHRAHQVVAVHRDTETLVPCDESISVDLLDAGATASSLGGRPFDVIIHCAGLVNVDACERDPNAAERANVELTGNVARFADANAVFVYVSTDQVYGRSGPRSEDRKHLTPANEYGRSKLRGEMIVTELRDQVLVVRTNVFGTNVKDGRLGSAEWIHSALRLGTKITLFRDYLFSPIYSRTLVRLVLQLIAASALGVYNVAAAAGCSKLDFGRAIAEAFGLSEGPIEGGSIHDHHFGAPRPDNLVLNVDKAVSIGLRLPSYKESVQAWRGDLAETADGTRT